MAYRSFFAIRGLSTGGGVPTNALFGYIRTERMLRERWEPTHLCAVFDGGLPEERTELLADYKAQRPPMPGELASQLPLIEEYCRLSGIPNLRMEGQEADDVMATWACRAARRGAEVFMATSDKDLFQCVNNRCLVVSPAGRGDPMDAEAVERKTGVPPRQIVPWLALVGDHSDNIDGVPGVGAKTASRWLKQYGSWEGILAHSDELTPPRFRRQIAQYTGTVQRNMKMVALRTDLGCPGEWDDLAWDGVPDRAALNAFLHRYELSSLADDQAQTGELF